MNLDRLTRLAHPRLVIFSLGISAGAFLKAGPAQGTGVTGPPRPPGQLVSWGTTVVPKLSPTAKFRALATGASHTVVLNDDGTVSGWGINSQRQLVIPAGISNVVAIAAGGADTLALREDGTVAGWGQNSARLQALLPSWTNMHSISLGTLRAIGLRRDGTLVEWVGSSPGVNAVPRPENLSNVVAVAAGGRHSLALLSDGSVVGWGYNFTSQAIAPQNATNVVAIAAGQTYSMALRADRTVVGWGTIDFVVTNVVKMAAGADQAIMLQENGALVQIELSRRSTSLVENASAVRQISAGDEFHMVLYENGELSGFGKNDRLQASTPRGFANVLQVASFADSSSFPAGTAHSIGLRADGSVFSWRSSPPGAINAPAGLTNVVAIAAGDSVGLALLSDGRVTGWGNSSNGRLAIPPDLTNAIAISTGGGHSLALRADGTVSAWGENLYGQTAVPAGLSNVAGIAAGRTHSMALREDGLVVCWGFNGSKQCDVPAGLAQVIAIAAGDRHSVALRENGTVVAWGDNMYKQTNVPPQLTGVVGIGAGPVHTVAHLDDGSIVAWGNTNAVAVPPGAANRRILSFASSEGETAAVVLPQPMLKGEFQSDRFDVRTWGFRGETYVLEHATQQPAVSWNETLRSGIDGKWGWMTLSDTNPAAGSRFYRVRVETGE